MDSSQISASGLRKFLKHLAVVSSKYKDREEAKDKLKKHVTKLRSSVVGKKTKKKIMSEFEHLEKKISMVLQKEAEILRLRGGDVANYKALMSRISENSDRVKMIDKQFSELKDKVEKMHDIKLDRETRIKALEKRIERGNTKKQALPELSAKLQFLEQKYLEMKNSGKYSDGDLDKIKFKIDSLKVKAAVSKF